MDEEKVPCDVEAGRLRNSGRRSPVSGGRQSPPFQSGFTTLSLSMFS